MRSEGTQPEQRPAGQRAVRRGGAGRRPPRARTPLRARRQRARCRFLARVGVLLTLITALGYAAWFARWAQPVKTVPIEVAP